MNKIGKYILSGVLFGILGLCLGASFAAGSLTRGNLVCKGMKVEIADSTREHFVTSKDVSEIVERSYGQVTGQRLLSLDLNRIEQIVDSRSAVRKSQAYVTTDGMLNIHITQRRPVVRFQKSDGGFYADKEGCIFPLQRTYASHVQIIDGDIPIKANTGYKGMIEDPAEREWFNNIMNVVNYMDSERTWRDKIVQIHVRSNGDLVLIPREGKEKFMFGQPTGIPDKFMKMEKYYTNIVPAKGQGYYRYIDVKYDGQIICRK